MMQLETRQVVPIVTLLAIEDLFTVDFSAMCEFAPRMESVPRVLLSPIVLDDGMRAASDEGGEGSEGEVVAVVDGRSLRRCFVMSMYAWRVLMRAHRWCAESDGEGM